MPAIETVRGPVEVAQLGQTLMHEHVFVLSEEIRRNSGNWDEEARVADAVAKLRALKSRGVDTIVDPARVVVGHSGDSTDLDYLIALMEAGSFIGMDRFGIDTILPFEQRCATVAELCRRGYAERMVLAHDASCYIDWFEERTLAKALPRWHLTHIHDDVLPELRSRGVTDAQIATMLVENPRRYFAA